MKRKTISIAQFTRHYYGEHKGQLIYYSDWISSNKVFDLIGDNSFTIDMCIAYYSDENRILESEFMIKEKESPAMKDFRGLVSPYRFKKFIEEKELDVNDYTYTRKDDSVIFDSGYIGEARVIFPKEDLAMLNSFLQKLDAPKKIFQTLIRNKGSMVKAYNDGKISIEKIDFDSYWESDFFSRFPEVQPKKSAINKKRNAH